MTTEGQEEIGTAGTSLPWLLFAVLGGAAAWTVHFLGSYAVIAIGCAAGWTAIRPVLAVATLALAAVAVWSAVVALRGWRRVSDHQPWDSALSEPHGWFGFLMLTGVLLSIASAFTIVLEGLPTLIVPVCSPSGLWR